MKRLAFILVGAASITLAACGSSNQDQVSNAQLNQPSAEDLNVLANQAAMDAANAEAANFAAQKRLQEENAAAETKVANPKEADEQNVSGM